MARPVDHQHREDLLERAVDYAVEHGLADLTLRPLAAGLGVAPNTLVHHFGDKNELLGEILNRVRDRLRAVPDRAAGEPLRSIWEWTSAPARRPFFRSFFQAYAVALRDQRRFGSFLDRVVHDWLPPGGNADAVARATLEVAVLRGLLLDLVATGDRERCDAAFALYERLGR